MYQDILEEHTSSRYASVVKALKKELPKVGAGSFGTVFDISEDKVLKVYRSHDHAYQTFQALASRVECQHFPKFYEHVLGTHYHYVVMEKVNHDITIDPIEISEMEMYIGWMEHDYKSAYVNAALAGALDCIRLLTLQYELDLRPCNFGRRQCGTLVILDPLVNTYKDRSKKCMN